MRRLVGLEALADAERGGAVTIGTFDGVHLGHRALIARTLAAARELEGPATLVTWDRHPLATLRPQQVPLQLTTPERRAELVGDTGIDALVVLPFDESFSHWTAEEFVRRLLVDGLAARAVFVGEGWRFGHKAAGDVALLRELGAAAGFTAHGVGLTDIEGQPVSSTRVREAVAAGNMELAATLLGRPFDVDGEVLHGDRRGTELGFPTANLLLDMSLAHPPRGIYAGRVSVDHDLWYVAATNIGVNPQFGGDPERSPWKVESYLLDYSGDLYGTTIRVELHHRLRDELRFDSVEALIAQMAADVDRTRELMA